MHTALISLAALAATACTGDRGSSFTRLEEAPRYELHEERRIGSGTDPNLGFTLISGVALDSEGLVYAFDARESELRVFNDDGQLVRKIGRRGQGPGEFTTTPIIGVLGDTVWTMESRGVVPSRLNLFTLNGELISTAEFHGARVTLQGERGTGIIFPTRLHDRLFYGHSMTIAGSRSGDAPAPALTDTVRVPRVRWNLVGEIIDTAGWYDELPLIAASGPLTVNPAGRPLLVPAPNPEQRLNVILADGVLMIDNGSPTGAASVAVIRLNDKGDTVSAHNYGYEAYPYDEAALEALAWQRARTGATTLADSMTAYSAVRAAMQFPPFQRPFGSHLVGEDGSVWLSRFKSTGSDQWLIFDGSGTLTGQLTIPLGTRIMRIDGDDVWASVLDDMDVPWLVQYSLQRMDT